MSEQKNPFTGHRLSPRLGPLSQKRKGPLTPEKLAVPGCPLLLLKVPADRARGTRPFSREPGGDAGRLPGPRDGRACSSKAGGRKGPLGHAGAAEGLGRTQPRRAHLPPCQLQQSRSPRKGDRGTTGRGSRQSLLPLEPRVSRERPQRCVPQEQDTRSPLLIRHRGVRAYRRPSSLLPPFGESPVKLDTDISAPALEIKITGGAERSSVPVYLRHNLKHPFVLITAPLPKGRSAKKA